MTVVAGLCSSGGVVVASDSQMSAGFVRRSEQKVWAGSDGSFVFGLAGAESSIHLLRDELLPLAVHGLTAGEIRQKIGRAFTEVLRPEYERVRGMLAPMQQGDLQNLPLAGGVVGAIAGGVPHLFSIDAFGTITDHIARGFASAGSGGAFAEHAVTVFRELRQQSLTVFQAEMLAFRVIEDAVAIGGPTAAVGGEVQMVTLTPEGASLHPRNDPLISDAVLEWRRVEGERFRLHQPPE